VFSYDGAFGFMGLFIMRPDRRGHGLGATLWHHRLDRMRARLRPDAAVGMDGVFRMAPFYARGGFVLAYRDLRFDGVAPTGDDVGLLSVDAVGIDAVDQYDRRHVAAPRSAFLRRWIEPDDVHTAVMVEDDAVVGMAVLRPCRDGYRFGPVHADRPDVAERLIRGLMGRVAGSPVQIDVPEPNEAGLDIVARLGMTESFGCARMYHGPDPHLPVERIYGVTSYEFG
jgi:GNAT superfamily N-acetyltransferase